MANDKDFILKNAVEVSGPTKTTIGTVTSDDIDLSTGNYFKDTPTGNSTYSISNAGDVQSFQLEVTGGTAEVAQNFSTTLYTGTNAAQTITNGLNLSGDGGMLWFKNRTLAEDPMIVDTVRGGTADLYPNETNAEDTDGSIASFNSDGFTFINTANARQNVSSYDYVSWAFKQQANFFDVVTYTGDGVAGLTVNHSLGGTVGSMFVKCTSHADDWYVYHRETGATHSSFLNTNAAAAANGAYWNNTAPTTTQFTVGDNAGVNANGRTYVAYLFAHDDAADGLIQCGSYTGGGSTDVEVNLGWQPQWLLIRRSDATEDWFLVDSERGFGIDGTDTAKVKANSNEAETTSTSLVATTPTGFKTTDDNAGFNSSGGTYIYMAIRAASDPDITWPSSVEWSGGTAPSSPAVGETDLYTFVTDDSGTSYTGIKSADNLS